MDIKTVSHSHYSPDLHPWDFCLFPMLRGRRYETIEEMKEAVMKVIDTLIQEHFHGALKKLLEQSNKFIAAGWDYFEGDQSFMCVLSIKVPMILVYRVLHFLCLSHKFKLMFSLHGSQVNKLTASLQRRKSSSTSVLIWHLTFWWWDSSDAGFSGNSKYLFITIAPW